MSHSFLQLQERLYHRDQLRAGRYAALADAEGFHAICFALEALGLRLHRKKSTLKIYEAKLRELARESIVLSKLAMSHPGKFSRFESLFDLVRTARNDAMHTGVYARHATLAAIELCIGLEEALMKGEQYPRQLVEDFMVKAPVIVDSWQPVALARQLMLTHSFSFIPVDIGGWKLISELALARYLRSSSDWNTLMSASIEEAATDKLKLLDARVIGLKQEIDDLLRDNSEVGLWLVEDEHRKLCGVLSPFELM